MVFRVNLTTSLLIFIISVVPTHVADAMTHLLYFSESCVDEFLHALRLPEASGA